MLRPGKAFNDVRLELGQHPEAEGIDKLSFPLTVNGKLTDTARYKFNARRGEELVFEIDARRAGSDVDSFLEGSGLPASDFLARPRVE